MKKVIPYVVLAAGLVLLAAGVMLGRTVGMEDSSLPSNARIEVDAGIKVASVGDILGAVVNEHYWGVSDPVHPDWYDDYLGRTVDRIKELAPVNGRKFGVRFGHTPTDGSWGKDGYHWQRALDPNVWDTSIDEFMEYVSLVNGEPYVAVNFGSGTAQEAAAMVSYANGTDNANEYVKLRQANGRVQPYNVRRWIIGFEQFAAWETGHLDTRDFDFANPEAKNGGDPAWHGKPSANPYHFAARAAEFIRQMRAASPIPLLLYVPLNNWDLEYWGGPEESVRAIMGALDGLVDGVAVHFYPANPGYGESNEDLLGRPDTLSSKLDQLRGLLAKYSRSGTPPDIGDVEFNNRSSSNGQSHELVNGLFVADTLRVLASKGVSSAFYFAISAPAGNRSGFTYFELGDMARPMPTYLATQLLARHLGVAVIKSDVSRSKMVTAPGGVSGSFSYPSLTCLASLSDDGRILYLVIINKHLVYDQKAEVSIHGFNPAGKAQFVLLNGMAANSIAGQVGITELELSTASSFTHIFPAHSVTGIRFHLSGR